MKKKVGVIIGRFQTHTLHKGHKHLIEEVRKMSDEVLVLVGSTKGQPTEKDPLSFQMRKDMILEEYPNLQVLNIDDHYSDSVWSKYVDEVVESVVHDCAVTLYGSRDSFIPYYFGKFNCLKVPEVVSESATDIRNNVRPHVGIGANFRAGMIHAQNMRLPIMYQVIDAIIFDAKKENILLAKKKDDLGWRFVGGFVDPKDLSLEDAVSREVKEEASISVGDISYLASYRTEDKRYEGSGDYILTAIFSVIHEGGIPKAGDDIAELKWFPKKEAMDHLMDEYKKSGMLLFASL